MDVRPHLPKRDNRNFQFSALNLIYVSVAFTPSGRVHRWVRFPLHPRRRIRSFLFFVRIREKWKREAVDATKQTIACSIYVSLHTRQQPL